LILSAKAKKIDAMRFLVSGNIELNSHNDEGNTALHYSCEK